MKRGVELHEDARARRVTAEGVRVVDHAYIRKGTANVYVMTEPKKGRRYVRVTRRRTRVAFHENTSCESLT